LSALPDVDPLPLPESRPFWDAVEQGELRLQQCGDCAKFHFPPSPACPHCSSRAQAWKPVSGRGTLYSYVIAQSPWPQWNADGPMSVALVELEEGPRLVSTVVDCPQTPEALRLDMPLAATFRPFGARRMLCFAPTEGA
jgi:uncharacterized protein